MLSGTPIQSNSPSLTTEEFNERFVMEENLPARLKHLAEGALSYDEWVDAMDAKARDKSMETV